MHSTNGAEKMAAFVEKTGIGYPVAADIDGKTFASYRCDSYPDYCLIDRAGNLRVADLANADLERAVKVLLAEDAPALSPLEEAIAKARKKDTRVLIAWNTRDAIDQAVREDRDLSRFLRNEYEVVVLELDDALIGAPTGAHGVTALDAGGAKLGELVWRDDLSGEALRTFLEEHRVPVKDAEALLAAALEQAKVERKRVLVHLGAPW